MLDDKYVLDRIAIQGQWTTPLRGAKRGQNIADPLDANTASEVWRN